MNELSSWRNTVPTAVRGVIAIGMLALAGSAANAQSCGDHCSPDDNLPFFLYDEMVVNGEPTSEWYEWPYPSPEPRYEESFIWNSFGPTDLGSWPANIVGSEAHRQACSIYELARNQNNCWDPISIPPLAPLDQCFMRGDPTEVCLQQNLIHEFRLCRAEPELQSACRDMAIEMYNFHNSAGGMSLINETRTELSRLASCTIAIGEWEAQECDLLDDPPYSQ